MLLLVFHRNVTVLLKWMVAVMTTKDNTCNFFFKLEKRLECCLPKSELDCKIKQQNSVFGFHVELEI